ncbi:ComF family protein [Paenibacillus glycinis]|uniref:ComF family protein n=1 Tax=Paenibacillus glycinis TaxID=2697035 RepID=A0ABW9XVK6_9BACL|nr:ComF family protein [Paenibacillus glycinis]NBD26722.1 ComF family protein [Paenibacillus glycinis]
MSVGSILRSFRRAFPAFTALLAANANACLVCGGRCEPRQQGHFGSLCRTCFRGIPWITRVYCLICGRPEHCPDCVRRARAAFVLSRSAVRYDAAIRAWIAQYKYGGNEAFEPLLGELLTMAYRGLCAELRLPPSMPRRFDAVIPVPVSEARLLERGFNQAERLGGRLAESEGIPLVDALRRTRHSVKQSAKTRGARLRDTHNLFRADSAAVAELLHSRSRPDSCRLLLIDDIYTTGSTVNACAEALADALRQAAPTLRFEIYCLTLARS